MKVMKITDNFVYNVVCNSEKLGSKVYYIAVQEEKFDFFDSNTERDQKIRQLIENEVDPYRIYSNIEIYVETSIDGEVFRFNI